MFAKRFFLTGMLWMCYVHLNAQTNHFNTNSAFWTEVNISGKIKGKFSYQLDYQFRRQGESDALRDQSQNEGNHSFLAYPYQQVIRPWVGYQVTPKFRVSLSPLGWWGTWTPTASSGLKFKPEFRTTLQAMYTQPIGRVALTQRLRYEFRFIGRDLPMDGSIPGDYYSDFDANRQGRFRSMTRAIIPLNNTKLETGTVYVNCYEEFFIGIGKNVAPNRDFDQNRFFLGLGYKFSPQFRLEAGYLNQIIPKEHTPTGRNLDMNHVLQVFVIVEDFNSFFKKKAE